MALSLCALLTAGGAVGDLIDLIDPAQSLKYWLSHPVLGEASFGPCRG